MVRRICARQRLAPGLFQQRSHAFADEFVEVVMRAAAERLVHADDLLLGVHDDDALGRGSLEHLGPQLRRCSITLSTLMGVKAVSTESRPWNCRRRADSTAHEGSGLPFQRTSNSSTEPWSPGAGRRARTPGSSPRSPGVGFAAAQPLGGGRVGMQHLVLGDGQ